MTKKIGDKKIESVKSTTRAGQVEETQSIKGVRGINPSSGVGAVKGVGGTAKRRATRVMTMAEREELFRMISEETDKMVAQGAIPASKKDVIASAVKMAVDSGLMPEPEAEPEEEP